MLKSRRQLLATTLLGSLLIVPAAAHQGGTEWLLIAPAGEGFSIRMPAKPEEQTDRIPLMGSTYQMRLYTSVDEANRLVYMVAMQEFPSAIGDLEPTKRME